MPPEPVQRSRNAVVALKPEVGHVRRLRSGQKQERRGGIETPLPARRQEQDQAKQERRGGIETKDEIRRDLARFGPEAGTPWWH